MCVVCCVCCVCCVAWVLVTVSWKGVSRVGVGFKVLVWSCSVPLDHPFPGPPFPGPPFSPFRLRRLRGFTRQPENSKRAHMSAPALQTPPKFHEKTPREGRKERILRRKREKREILGGPGFQSVDRLWPNRLWPILVF